MICSSGYLLRLIFQIVNRGLFVLLNGYLHHPFGAFYKSGFLLDLGLSLFRQIGIALQVNWL